MKILVLGGCGYIGTKLVEKLLKYKKFKVIVFDVQWFGKNLRMHKNLKVICVAYTCFLLIQIFFSNMKDRHVECS